MWLAVYGVWCVIGPRGGAYISPSYYACSKHAHAMHGWLGKFGNNRYLRCRFEVEFSALVFFFFFKVLSFPFYSTFSILLSSFF